MLLSDEHTAVEASEVELEHLEHVVIAHLPTIQAGKV